jgi:hypothetical protein
MLSARWSGASDDQAGLIGPTYRDAVIGGFALGGTNAQKRGSQA